MNSFRNWILLFILSTLFSSCKQNILESNKKLENRIYYQIASQSKILDLSSLIDIKWDNLLILAPYTNLKKDEAKLGIDLGSVQSTLIESREDICVIAFLLNKKVIAIVEYPRNKGDFADNELELIKKNEATFEILNSLQKTLDSKHVVVFSKK